MAGGGLFVLDANVWMIDPVMGKPAQPITLNRYLYANSDPVNLIDPTGRSAAIAWTAFVGMAASTIITTAIPRQSTFFKWCGTAANVGGSAVFLSAQALLTVANATVGPLVALAGVGLCVVADMIAYGP